MYSAPAGYRTAVLNPFTGLDDDRLPGPHVESRVFQLDLQAAPQDDRVFVEFRCLPRLQPARWAFHAGDTYCYRAGVDPPDEFLDGLRWLPRRFDDCWFLDEIAQVRFLRWDQNQGHHPTAPLEAQAEQSQAETTGVERLLGRANSLPWQQTDPVGEGEEYRANQGEEVHAPALTLHDAPVHVSVVVAG